MKKTLIALGIVFILVVILQLVFFYNLVSFRALVSDDPVQLVATVRDREIVLAEDGSTFQIKGVLVDSCKPGHYSNDFEITEEEYYAWMEQIAQMGANTISVYSVMDSEFYKALLEFNTQAEAPLYLIQGVSVPDYNLNNAKDGYESFYDKLLSDAQYTIDAVHGNKVVALGRVQSSGNYINDVSPWTLGYLLGSEWVPYTLAYTDHKGGNPQSFQGQYYQTTPEATSSEVMFAQLMEELTDYETKNYNSQKLMGFSNGTATDPLTYNQDVRMQLEKCVELNASHVLPTEKALAGCFAGYFLRGEMEDFKSCLGNTDWQNFGGVLTQVDYSTIYGGYVDFLTKLHEMPVVISYGFSSARGSDEPEPPLTELEQGQAMMEAYRGFMEAGCQGAIIATWQDNWSRTSWNTMYAIDEESEQNWLDVQTVNNGFGILSFDPGREESVCYVDGDIGEWSQEDVLLRQTGRELSYRYDEAYLYLMLKGQNAVEPLYLPMDVTPQTGSTWEQETGVRFDAYADFLLVLDGTQNSRLLVHQRYDSTYMAYEKRISGKNAFDFVPDVNAGIFGPIRHVLRNPIDPDAGLVDMDVDERMVFNFYSVRETGALRHGNGNPKAADYDSLADFCYGEDCVEIRLPWQLLNFSNPSEMKIHQDYYPVYGVEEQKIDHISIGVAAQDTQAVIDMIQLPLKGWKERVQYHERLKQSYYVIQAAWGGGVK